MKNWKKWTACSVAAFMLSCSLQANDACYTNCADDVCYVDNSSCGYGYENCCRAPCISPYIALGVVAVAAVVAVIVNNNDSSHSNHAHS